jgi:hypothetical protein
VQTQKTPVAQSTQNTRLQFQTLLTTIFLVKEVTSQLNFLAEIVIVKRLKILLELVNLLLIHYLMILKIISFFWVHQRFLTI